MPSLYEITIPTFIHGLRTVSSLLSKGKAHYSTSEANALTQPSNFGTLAHHIQRLSDNCDMCAVRIAKVNNVPMVNNEVTFAELEDRIGMTISFLETITPEMMDGKESEEVAVTTRAGERKFTAMKYVLEHAIPIFYFHFCMVYAILRSKGVQVEKHDYLNLGTPYEYNLVD